MAGRTSSWDVVIVGGGMAGLATAYHLARRRARVLLLDGGELGCAASGANAGRAQTLEAYPGLNARLVKMGHARLAALREELGVDVEWRLMGNLVLIREERHWHEWAEQARHLTADGIPIEMISPQRVRELEPAVSVDGLLGAAYGMEANVNPFRFCWAYAKAARRQGAALLPYTPASGFQVRGGRVQAVSTGADHYTAGAVVIAAGPWTAQVAGWAGAPVPVGFHYAEAMVTEPLPPLLTNHVGLAGFYNVIHGSPRACTAGVLQTKHGNLVITEAVEQTQELHRRSTSWGMSGMARELLWILPSLRGVQLIRDWGVPSAVSPDEQPIVGWAGEPENLFIAGRLHLNIATVPVVCDLAAGMILGETVEPSLEEYSPRRFGSLSRAGLKPAPPAGQGRAAEGGR